MISRHIAHGQREAKVAEAANPGTGTTAVKLEDHDQSESAVGDQDVPTLAAGLGSRYGDVRERCRKALEAGGEPALDALIQALSDHRKTVRWEAAKALRKFRDPRAIPALLAALNDKAFAVRWLAGEALAAIGPDVVVPLLNTLVEHMDSQDCRESAHHVLHELRLRQGLRYLKPVIESLDSDEPEGAVPVAVHHVLEALGTH